MSASADVAAYHGAVRDFAQETIRESLPAAELRAREATHRVLGQEPETHLMLFRSGLLVDASKFVAAHASDVTPTSVGVSAVRLSRVEAVIDDVLDRVWGRLGSTGVVDNGVRCAPMMRDGLLSAVPLELLSVLEIAFILSEAW